MKREKPAALREAIEMAGSQTKLAVVLGIHKSNISQWVRRGRVPSKHAIEMQRHFGIVAMRFNEQVES